MIARVLNAHLHYQVIKKWSSIRVLDKIVLLSDYYILKSHQVGFHHAFKIVKHY